HGLQKQAVLFIPPTGLPREDHALFVSPLLHCTHAQNFSKERVVAIPAPLLIEWLHKESSTFERFEHRLSIGAPSQGITQRGREPIQECRREQEGMHLLRLVRKHLFKQIIDHM